MATLCQAGFFNENNADSEDKTMVQEDQDICQRQVDQLAKALKTCYEAPSSPPISGFLKRDLARGKPPVLYTVGHNLEHEFFCLGHLGSSGQQGKKMHLSFSEQL